MIKYGIIFFHIQYKRKSLYFVIKVKAIVNAIISYFTGLISLDLFHWTFRNHSKQDLVSLTLHGDGTMNQPFVLNKH